MPVHLTPDAQFPAIVSYPQPSRLRTGILALLLLVSAVANVSPSYSQTTSSAENLRKGQMLYQVYATASACATEGLYFSQGELSGIGDAVNKSLSALDLSDEERDQLWTSVQRMIQIAPPYPALCLDARRWLALSVPDAFSGSTQEKPF